MLARVLIANRGEIAVRIARACRELGIVSVAVYSDADRLAPHVLAADEAYFIGPSPAAASYLNASRLVEIAHRCNCDAIHPGYGFLAERASFAAQVTAAGMRFVGPGPAAIRAMGEKTEARRRMVAAGVPVVPGETSPLSSVAEAEATAERLGYPVLLKAAAGGGGKGMRVVRARSELPRALEAARHEARAAFGDEQVYLEKYLDRPRHIEIQVLADAHGGLVHLGERDCSVQRRHQKMIEEAPAPALTAEVRQRMGDAAIAAARAVAYESAGTIEFLYHLGEFYVLEMNTRIQVEHPVTELVTGIDLVQWQLRIAGGEALAFGQDQVRLRGHAIECRITSEDAANGFLPSTGRIELLDVPSGPGVRWDGGVVEGYAVSLYYDPLLGKLIAYAGDRAAAIERMQRALRELRIVGVETCVPFHRAVLAEPDFRAGNTDTTYLERHPAVLDFSPSEESLRAAAVAAALLEDQHRRRAGVTRIGRPGEPPARSAWRQREWRW
jgi:acetyl-CoA carboxylase biotin carboxylase subunit